MGAPFGGVEAADNRKQPGVFFAAKPQKAGRCTVAVPAGRLGSGEQVSPRVLPRNPSIRAAYWQNFQ
jgi:hypothetical protein